MKRYKFQALVTLAPSREPGPAPMVAGKPRRTVVRGQNHETGLDKFFSGLVTKSYETPWPGDKQVIVTVVLVGDDPRGYFDIGDHFALWTGSDLGNGVVTQRLFV